MTIFQLFSCILQLYKDCLKSLGLASSGNQEAMINRSSAHYQVSTAAAPQADDADDQQEAGATDNGENEGPDFNGDEVEETAAADVGVDVDLSEQVLREAEERLREACNPDEDEIAGLLASREKWVKEYWDFHLPTATAAFKSRKSKDDTCLLVVRGFVGCLVTWWR